MEVLEKYRTPQLEGGERDGSDAIFNSRYQLDVAEAISAWKSQRVLVVLSKTLATNTHMVAGLTQSLGPRLVDVKLGVGAHSPYADVIDIAHRITRNEIDCLLCIGSGSYSDACKAARLLAATLPPGFDENDIEALMDQSVGLASEAAIKKSELKLVLVPTSLSAGEWSWAASCTNSAGKKQHIGLKDGCAPDLILLDPWIAGSSPEELWLSSGFRAIDHAVESLCSAKCAEQPAAQAWCEIALADLTSGLVRYRAGLGSHDQGLLSGISKCQAGSRMAFMSFLVYGIPFGASHAIGHQLGSVAGVRHGITSCIMLPAVLRYTKASTHVAQKRIVDVFNVSMSWSETDAATCVFRLAKILGLPTSMTEVGVTEESQIERIIDNTMTDAMFIFGIQFTRQDISNIVYSAR